MTLIDRYVREVARRLPSRQRADVEKELRSTLMDALESRFGPRPTEADAVTLLREFGSPEATAASYVPARGYLIGPGWYPTFSRVVRIYMLALVTVLTVAFGVTIFVQAPGGDVAGALADLLGGGVNVALFAFGAIVSIFFLLERAGVAPQEPRRQEWDPRQLPGVEEGARVSRGEAVLSLAITAVTLILLFQFRDLIGVPGTGEPPLLNDVLRDNLLWLGVAGVLTMAMYAFLLWQGRWRWYSRLANLLVDLFGVYVLYRIGAAVAAEKATLTAAGLPESFIRWLEQTAYAVPLVALVIILLLYLRPMMHARQGQRSSGAVL